MQISSSKKPRISVLILVHQRLDLLKSCILSLEKHVSYQNWELLLVLNGASKSVEDWLAQYRLGSILPVTLHKVEPSRPGAARVLGAKYASGDVLLFLDDDIELFQDIVWECACLFEDSAITAAGGANLTPLGSSVLARASGSIMSTYLGAASMSQRYYIQDKSYDANEHSLILCNLAVRASAFKKYSFPMHFVSNEENILLQQLEADGAKLICSPRMAVYHHRRKTFFGIAEQNFKYGLGRAQNILAYPRSLRSMYFLPTFFLLSHIFLNWLLFPFLLYGLIVLLQSFLISFRNKDFNILPVVPIVYYLIHMFYGLGFLIGMLAWFWRKRTLCETT